jgi:hypothetical protein
MAANHSPSFNNWRLPEDDSPHQDWGTRLLFEISTNYDFSTLMTVTSTEQPSVPVPSHRT